MRHYTSDELLAYLDGNDGIVDLAAVRDHVGLCVPCRKRLQTVETEYLRLADSSLWRDIADAPLRDAPPPERLAQYVALQERMIKEEARAEEVFAELRLLPRDAWAQHLRTAPDAQTAAMMRRLVTAARTEEEVDPREALAILDVAEALGAFVEDADLRMPALAELRRARAMALMIRGDYPEALAVLDIAERSTSGVVAPYERAFVSWARATVFFQMGRYAEALPLVRRSVRIFHEFGDELRELQTMILYASILTEQGAIKKAQRVFRSLLEPLQAFGDRVSLARVLANLACCAVQRHDFAASEAYGTQAAALFDELGLETEKVRTHWAFGIAYIRRGDVAEGIARLHDVAAEFRARGMLVDAGEVDLEIVAAWISEGSYERAAHVARELVQVFVRADARLDVVRALHYLRDAVERMSATTALVRSVRYVLTHPGQPFTAPETDVM